MSSVTMKDPREAIRDDIRTNPDRPIEALVVKYPELDQWSLRLIRREVLAERAAIELPDTESLLQQPLSKSAAGVLRAGFFRPLVCEVPEFPGAHKPIWKKAGEEILVLPDIHAPIQDDRALDAAMQVGRSIRPDRVVFNGDGFDVHSLARYAPSAARPYRFVDERTSALPVIGRVVSAFPDAEKVWIFGNHDTRPDDFLAATAPQLQGLFSLQELLGISNFDFTYPENNRLMLANGQLVIKHGIKVAGEAGRSVEKEVKDHGMSVVMGHVHRLAYYSVTRTRQKIDNVQPLVGVELGCLQNLNPDYLEPEQTANWQHGCAVVTIYDNGLYNIEPVPIFDGNAFFRGRIFSSTIRRK